MSDIAAEASLAKMRPPPRTTSGPIAWVRENLFSTFGNTVLTLLGLYITYEIVSGVLSWAFFNATWQGSDGSACTRENEGTDRKLDQVLERLAAVEKKLDARPAGPAAPAAGAPMRGQQQPGGPQPQRPGAPNPSEVYSVDITGDPVRGAANAKVTIVEAFEFACPFCQKVSGTIDQLVKDYPGQVRVVSPFVGGAFGSGLRPQYHVFLAVLAARELKRSVRVSLTRQQMWSFGRRPATWQRVQLGAAADGRLQAVTHAAVAETSRFEDFSEEVVNWSGLLYRCDNAAFEHKLATLDVYTPIDMRANPPEKGQWLSPVLVDAVAKTLAAREQSLLFLNRRGYAPLTLCRSCGHRFECPQCTAWLVEHRFRHRLNCHHCGFSMPVPQTCPKCGEEGSLVACGPGGGAREDHVLHAVAAHHARAVLAHHPAQRLEQVRLAAAVRADHAGQPRIDHELGRVDEALEPEKAQAGELHADALLLTVAQVHVRRCVCQPHMACRARRRPTSRGS